MTMADKDLLQIKIKEVVNFGFIRVQLGLGILIVINLDNYYERYEKESEHLCSSTITEKLIFTILIFN